MRIIWQETGRHDTGVTAITDGFVSASAQRLTRWRVEGDAATATSEVIAPSPLPGPLRTGPDGAAVAWGPTLVRDGVLAWATGDLVAAALADLGEGAVRWFRLEAGAVDPAGIRVALDLRAVKPRTEPDRTPATPGVAARLAVLRVDTATLERADDGRRPTCLAWADDVLLAGDRGAVHALGTADRVLDLGDPPTAARALAVAADDRIATGLADGRIMLFPGAGRDRDAGWDGHDGPVTALAWSGEVLASAGQDGTVRTWTGDAETGRLDLGAPVDAVGWLDGDRLVVKAGGQGGRLVLVATS